MRRLLVFVLAAAGAVACGPPRVHIEWDRPPAFNLPKTVKVAVKAEADQVTAAASNPLDTMIGVTRGQVMPAAMSADALREAWTVRLQREGYTVVDASQAEALVRIRPTKWTYGLSGRSLTSGSGRLDARVEIFNAKDPNAPALYQESYWATASAGTLGEPEAMTKASRAMAGAFMDDLSPSRVGATVVMDDGDDVVRTGLELCKQGQYDAAYAAFTDAVAKAPTSAPAHYNLGIMAEARRQYDQAEELIVKATKLNGKPFYYTALERVRGARAELQGQ